MLLELKKSCKEGFPAWLCLSILLAVTGSCLSPRLPPHEQSPPMPMPERLGGKAGGQSRHQGCTDTWREVRERRPSPFPADRAVREAAQRSLGLTPA